MPDKFDPYREALVVETKTIWPEQLGEIDAAERKRIEERLHADAARVSQFEYVRLATGFCRQITVTAEDLQRVRNK